MILVYISHLLGSVCWLLMCCRAWNTSSLGRLVNSNFFAGLLCCNNGKYRLFINFHANSSPVAIAIAKIEITALSVLWIFPISLRLSFSLCFRWCSLVWMRLSSCWLNRHEVLISQLLDILDLIIMKIRNVYFAVVYVLLSVILCFLLECFLLLKCNLWVRLSVIWRFTHSTLYGISG